MRVTVNGEVLELEEGSSVASLVERFSLRPEQVAVEVNEALVPRAEHAHHALGEGDRVELVTLVGGG